MDKDKLKRRYEDAETVFDRALAAVLASRYSLLIVAAAIVAVIWGALWISR